MEAEGPIVLEGGAAEAVEPEAELRAPAPEILVPEVTPLLGTGERVAVSVSREAAWRDDLVAAPVNAREMSLGRRRRPEPMDVMDVRSDRIGPAAAWRETDHNGRRRGNDR